MEDQKGNDRRSFCGMKARFIMLKRIANNKTAVLDPLVVSTCTACFTIKDCNKDKDKSRPVHGGFEADRMIRG